MKLQSKNNVPDSDCNSDINPIKDIMTSNTRQRILISDEDADTLKRLKENPPPPTPELIEMLKQNLKSR